MYDLRCIVAADGVPVAPCGSVAGVALVPVAVPVEPAFDPASGPVVFGWALTLVGGVYVVGLVTGAIMRIIRSA